MKPPQVIGSEDKQAKAGRGPIFEEAIFRHYATCLLPQPSIHNPSIRVQRHPRSLNKHLACTPVVQLNTPSSPRGANDSGNVNEQRNHCGHSISRISCASRTSRKVPEKAVCAVPAGMNHNLTSACISHHVVHPSHTPKPCGGFPETCGLLGINETLMRL